MTLDVTKSTIDSAMSLELLLLSIFKKCTITTLCLLLIQLSLCSYCCLRSLHYSYIGQDYCCSIDRDVTIAKVNATSVINTDLR